MLAFSHNSSRVFFFRRPGPSVALEGEDNDEEDLLDIMLKNEQK